MKKTLMTAGFVALMGTSAMAEGIGVSMALFDDNFLTVLRNGMDAKGKELGVVTSGSLGPTVGSPVALAYLPSSHTAVGTPVFALVRDKRVAMSVAPTPFAPHRYFRG